jgi:hypothetical protein
MALSLLHSNTSLGTVSMNTHLLRWVCEVLEPWL